MANETDSDFFAMRIASAAEADRANETIQSMRGYIATVDLQLTAVEDGYVSPTSTELDLKLNQIDAVSRILEGIAGSEGSRSSMISEIRVQLEALASRVQSLLPPVE